MSIHDHLAGNNRFAFTTDTFAADKFAVVNMEGVESISQPFRFTLTLVSDDAEIDFDTMLKQKSTFRIFAPDGGMDTPYHGVLCEFEQLHAADNYVFYRAVLVPRLWQLSLYKVSEVYLNEQTIPDILREVLKGCRLTSADVDLKLTGQYRARSFVCQYQESHLAFLSRWMEKEGMYYFFDHDGGRDRLVIVDNLRMHPAPQLEVNYRPVDQLDVGNAPDSVHGFVCRQKQLPQRVLLKDFNYRHAGTELSVSAPVAENGVGDVMLYGENFRTLEEGTHYAKLRAEQIICNGKVFAGEGTAVGLRSGHFIKLAHHYRANFNARYLVTEVRHEGSQAGALLAGMRHPFGEMDGETMYRSSFHAIPAGLQFRPELVTPRPRLSGTMNATIDSEGDDGYADLDEFGQYKVQLPFDCSDKHAGKASARVRMATPYSGSNHGMHFPLHKHAEVLLSFIDGDPDQPVIMGAVPNSQNPSVVDQTNERVNLINTSGGNQLYMGDDKGKEVIWLNSPFHSSSIGIGSVDPGGGGSIYTATKGSRESVAFGASGDLSFGPKNIFSLGTESRIGAGVANKVSMGAGVAISCANEIKWTMNLASAHKAPAAEPLESLAIDESSAVRLDESSDQSILNQLVFAAGALESDVNAETVNATRQRLKELIRNFNELNMTQSAAFDSAVNDRAAPDAAPGKKAFMGWPGIIDKFGTDIVQNLDAFDHIKGSAKTLTTQIKDLKKTLVSKLALDQAGIVATVKLPGVIDNTLAMKSDGMTMTAWDTPDHGASLKLQLELAELRTVPGNRMFIDTTTAGVVFDASSVQLDKASIKLTTGDSAIELTESISLKRKGASMTITDDKIDLKRGAAALEIEAAKLTLKNSSDSYVKVTPQAVSLCLQSTKLQLSPTGATLSGQLIKLG